MSAVSGTYNLGRDPFGKTLYLVRREGRWLLQEAGGEPIHLSDEQIRLMADVAGVAKAAGR